MLVQLGYSSKSLKRFMLLGLLLVPAILLKDAVAQSKSDLFLGDERTSPTLNVGAQVYIQYCGLCHGENGKGNGVLAQKFKFYPPTDLLKVKHATDTKSTHEVIAYGGTKGSVSSFMPPMANELSWTQLESVVLFVELLRSDYQQAVTLLGEQSDNGKVSRRLGQETFKSRCVLCHGNYGEGDGRMAKILKDPAPFDLTASRQNDGFLKKIITGGGESVSRSKHMPPWGDELSESEIDSVIIYIKSIRD